MSAYFIANLKIHDQDEYQKYLIYVEDTVTKYHGKYLVVDKNPEILEGKWDYSRLVLIEFPDKEALKKWYHSAEYQDILKMRLSSADGDVIIVK
jgi:uncharacterized protein (DUF1330 family)